MGNEKAFLPSGSSCDVSNCASVLHHGTLSHKLDRNNSNDPLLADLVVAADNHAAGVERPPPVCDTAASAASATHKGTGISVSSIQVRLPAPPPPFYFLNYDKFSHPCPQNVENYIILVLENCIH